jgi:ribose transport system substrate-binding protein
VSALRWQRWPRLPRLRVPLLLAAIGLLVVACVTVSDDQPSPQAEATEQPTRDPALTPSAGTSASASAGSTKPTDAATQTPNAHPSLSVEPSIGYISLDESVPFAQAVSDGVRREAQAAGIELVECDSGWSRDGALGCAAAMAGAGVHGLISFQAFVADAEGICDTVGGVPTVGIVFDQGPCQVALLTIDQAESGRLAGEAMGRFADRRWGCDVSAYVSLESGPSDVDGGARMQGYRDGFGQHCELPDAEHHLASADRFVTAQKQVGDLLVGLDGDRIVVVGLTEDAILGAMAAASSAGRADDLWYSGQLADPSIRQHIACNEHYVASVAQFPERFGELVVPAALAAMQGQQVSSTMVAPLELVDADNIRQLYPDTPACGK